MPPRTGSAPFRRPQAGQLQMWSADALAEEGAGEPVAAPAPVDGSFTLGPLGGGAPGASPPLQELALGAGDAITSAAALEQEPFVLLGCRSGDVRVALVADAAGAGAAVAHQAHSLALLPYKSGCRRDGQPGGACGERAVCPQQALADHVPSRPHSSHRCCLPTPQPPQSRRPSCSAAARSSPCRPAPAATRSCC
jgi:hypothetical protein